MHTNSCEYCLKEFISKYKRKFCSDSCRTMFYRRKNNPHQHLNKTCLKCGKEFRGTHSAKYCSKECGHVIKNCLLCNKEFEGHFNTRFCSMKCKDKYKVNKPTGENKACLVCGKEYEMTYGKKRNKKQVCSVTCGNILATSKAGEIISINQIEEVIKTLTEQPSALVVANILNTSHTMIISRAKDYYGSYREMIISLRGTYLVLEDDKSYTANSLFSMIDSIYNVIGIREKTFSDLTNPKTKANLRIDYFLPNIPLAVEYHGTQHYNEVEFFDSKDSNTLEDRQFRDAIKERYLKKNKIPLVVFNYMEEINESNIKSKLDIYLKR